MEKLPALLLALFITGIIAADYYLISSLEEVKRERVQIVQVLDGDTVKLADGRSVRLLNINAPEKKEPTSQLALTYLARFKDSYVDMENMGTEKYGRTLGRLYNGSAYLNFELVEQGFAQTFLIDAAEEDSFKEAEREAIAEEKGIWQRSPDYACLIASINKNEEYIVMEKRCSASLKGWTLKDESTKTYRFKSEPAEEFILYSSKGTDNATALFWGNTNVWNNDKDAILIADAAGLLVFYDDYGY